MFHNGPAGLHKTFYLLETLSYPLWAIRCISYAHMPEESTMTSDLLRLSRELIIAEIERFYAASQPIAFETTEEISA